MDLLVPKVVFFSSPLVLEICQEFINMRQRSSTWTRGSCKMWQWLNTEPSVNLNANWLWNSKLLKCPWARRWTPNTSPRPLFSCGGCNLRWRSGAKREISRLGTSGVSQEKACELKSQKFHASPHHKTLRWQIICLPLLLSMWHSFSLTASLFLSPPVLLWTQQPRRCQDNEGVDSPSVPVSMCVCLRVCVCKIADKSHI